MLIFHKLVKIDRRIVQLINEKYVFEFNIMKYNELVFRKRIQIMPILPKQLIISKEADS